jgi:hypothetical protein
MQNIYSEDTLVILPQSKNSFSCCYALHKCMTYRWKTVKRFSILALSNTFLVHRDRYKKYKNHLIQSQVILFMEIDIKCTCFIKDSCLFLCSTALTFGLYYTYCCFVWYSYHFLKQSDYDEIN